MKKIVYGLLLLFIIGVIGTIISVSASGGFSLDTYNVNDKVVVNNKDISKVEIDLSSSDLTVLPTTDKEITVEFNGKISKKLKKKIKLDVKERDNTLKIELKDEDQIKFNIGVMIVDTNVEVYLPEKIYESLKIDLSSGDIEMENIKSKEFILEASSGDIIVRDLEATINQFHTSSGEIKASNIIGNIAADTSSGDITIQNEDVTGDIKAEASSGDVTVEFKEEPSSLAIEFRASSGEGEVTLAGVSYEEKTENKIKGKIGSGEFNLKVDTSSGDFYLK
jgi:lia operon protein LiaG